MYIADQPSGLVLLSVLRGMLERTSTSRRIDVSGGPMTWPRWIELLPTGNIDGISAQGVIVAGLIDSRTSGPGDCRAPNFYPCPKYPSH